MFRRILNRHPNVALVLGAVVVFVVVTGLVLLVYGVINLNRLAATAQHNDRQGQQARRILLAQGRLLVECTTAPGERRPPVLHPSSHDCFQRQEVRSSRTIGTLSAFITAASACGAEHPGNYQATASCTRAALVAAGVTLSP